MLGLSKQQVKNSGIFIGIVADNVDPDRLGRLKVTIPGYNDNVELDDIQWANACFPYGGFKDEGFFFIPSVGAEVVVMFPGGAETPIWLGCINKKVENPGPRESTQEADDDHYAHRKQIKTRVGWVMFDDKDEYITISHNCGSFITLDKDGDITIRAERNVNIKAGKNVSISAENGSYSVEAFHSAKMETHKGELCISSDEGKLLLTALKNDLNVVSKKQVGLIANENIKIYADQNVDTTSAKASVTVNAKKNIENYASEECKIHSEKDAAIHSSKDVIFDAGNDMINYAVKKFTATSGDVGSFNFAQSTDLTLGSGDLNFSTEGVINLHAEKGVTISSGSELGISSGKDMSISSSNNLGISSTRSTTINATDSINVRSLKNTNITAAVRASVSGQEELVIGGNRTQISGGELIGFDTTGFVRSKATTWFVEAQEIVESSSSKVCKSSSVMENSGSTHCIKAGVIRLN